jgi:hypothetical protein
LQSTTLREGKAARARSARNIAAVGLEKPRSQ